LNYGIPASIPNLLLLNIGVLHVGDTCMLLSGYAACNKGATQQVRGEKRASFKAKKELEDIVAANTARLAEVETALLSMNKLSHASAHQGKQGLLIADSASGQVLTLWVRATPYCVGQSNA
jgi:hypothetical protein